MVHFLNSLELYDEKYEDLPLQDLITQGVYYRSALIYGIISLNRWLWYFHEICVQKLFTGKSLNFDIASNDMSKIEKATRGQAAIANWFKF